jgi:hypothetical protein
MMRTSDHAIGGCFWFAAAAAVPGDRQLVAAASGSTAVYLDGFPTRPQTGRRFVVFSGEIHRMGTPHDAGLRAWACFQGGRLACGKAETRDETA